MASVVSARKSLSVTSAALIVLELKIIAMAKNVALMELDLTKISPGFAVWSADM
jgi:hypothetical protein